MINESRLFESLFDLPLFIAGPAIIVLLCLFAIGGLLLVRRRVLPRLRVRVEDSEFTGSMVQSVMVSAVMWIVIVAGALISLSGAFFFRVEDARLHGMLVTLLATFIGLVIFMILALDHPFRGDLGLRPEPYQFLYDQLMKP